MQFEVKKAKMTDFVIKSIIEIDKEFYTNFDYNDLSWYYERYSDKNDVFLLIVDGKIVGYFVFVQISKQLFDDIVSLKYSNDYDFPAKDWNKKSGYYYLPSVLVKKEFRQFSLPLLERLYIEMQKKKNLVVIAVSKEGNILAKKTLNFVGVADAEKYICVYKK